MSQRHLEWEGCFNVRDLGGLRASDGRATQRGRVIRADALDGLTAAGWDAVLGYGVRTVIDLRNDDEVTADQSPRPASITTVRLPLDGSDDREFWDVWGNGPQFGTPLYYGPHLERFPERSAAVVAAIARAAPGGVVFHCGGGRDRAGQVAMLVLALAGVGPAGIAKDYELSHERLPAKFATRGEDDPGPGLRRFLAERGTSAGELIASLLSELDVEALLGDAGLAPEDVVSLRRRLLDPLPDSATT